MSGVSDGAILRLYRHSEDRTLPSTGIWFLLKRPIVAAMSTASKLVTPMMRWEVSRDWM